MPLAFGMDCEESCFVGTTRRSGTIPRTAGSEPIAASESFDPAPILDQSKYCQGTSKLLAVWRLVGDPTWWIVDQKTFGVSDYASPSLTSEIGRTQRMEHEREY